MMPFAFARKRLIAVTLTMGALGCGGCTIALDQMGADKEPPAAPSEAAARDVKAEEMRDLTPAERTLLADSFGSSLNDPESLRFRWTRVPARLPNYSFEYCGMVDVKTAKGNYGGMQPFLATVTTANGAISGGAIASIDSDNRRENRDVIPKLCKSKGLDPLSAK